MPNSMRQALAGQRPDGPHPDPDLLSGFVEGSLGERERESVFAHLATCSRCREVVDVSTAAAPTEAAAQVVVAVPATKSFGVRFAWLASAAAIAILATVVVIHESEKQASDSVSSATPTQQTAQATQERAPGPPSRNESVQQNAVPPGQAPAPESKTRQLTAKSIPSAPQAVRSPEIKLENAPRQDSREVITVQATPLEGIAPANANDNAFAGKNVISTDKLGGVTASGIGGTGSGSGAAVGSARSNVYMARVAPTPNADQQAPTPAAAFGEPTSLKKAATLASATLQHWRIDNGGHLQRTNAQGQWETLLESERVRFRVVSILGNDVWAGGEKLRLYHSSDSGTNWKVANLPPKNGQDQSITHVHFESPQVGRAESDSGTVWTTNDGGLTWK